MSVANGRRIVTITDVAAAAGVSPSTVSRVLTGSHRVREAREKRVLEAASRLGYRPNAAARALRRSRTMTLGIVWRRIDQPMQMSILTGLTARTQASDYSLLVTSAQNSASLYNTLIQKLFEARVDGLFLATPVDLQDSLRPYQQADIPVLALFTKDDSAADLPLVTADEDPAIGDAMRRLLALGHRRFGQLTSRVGLELSQRVTSIDGGLRESGLSDTSHRVELAGTEATPSAVRDAMERLLDHATRPTAAFFPEPYIQPVMTVLAGRGLMTPRDISLVAYNDSPLAALMSPSISSISVEGEDIGRVAADVMIAWLRGRPPSAITFAMPAQFRERASVGPAPDA